MERRGRPAKRDNNDPAVIAAELMAMQRQSGPSDLIALTEVENANLATDETAVEIDGVD